MKAGSPSKIDLMHDLMRFAKMIESLGNTAWSQSDLAVQLQISTRTVSRYLSTLTKVYGLRLSIKNGIGKNCVVIGKWSFIEALKKQYQGVNCEQS